ncbi:MAG: hypothetical protein AB7G44_11080 [Bacteroidia bacterium]
MKKILTSICVTLTIFSAFSQSNDKVNLTLDPASSKYSYTRVIDLSGYSKEILRKAVQDIIPVAARLTDTEDLLLYNNTLSLTGDAFATYFVRISFKDDKLRIETTDFNYDNRAWGFSAPQKLETIDGKKLNKVIETINGRLEESFTNFKKKVDNNLRLTATPDW